MKPMKYFVPLLIILICNFLSAEDGASILKKADQYRGTEGSFAMESTVTAYKDDVEESSLDLKIYVGDKKNSIVKFLGPGKSKGQVMLMSGNNVWIYFKKTKNPLRLTPQQRLLGEASNGDVARTNYTGDYDAELAGTVEVDGTSCYHLNLTAKEKGTTYQRIDYFVSKADSRPVKALFYAQSGKLLKEGRFSHPKKMGGKTILTRLTLVDAIKKGETTVIETTALSGETLPSQYFNKNYLERIK